MSSPQMPSPAYGQERGQLDSQLRLTQKSVPELLQDIASNLEDMIRGEFRLAKAEVKEEAARAAPAGKTLAIGIFTAFYGAGFLLLAAVYGLAMIFEIWFAALIVGAVLSIIAVVLVSSASGRLRQLDPKPDKTIRSLEENVQWAKNRMK
jgi:uncharacterized membrane protein YqjE